MRKLRGKVEWSAGMELVGQLAELTTRSAPLG